jgi:hypothetical protein
MKDLTPLLILAGAYLLFMQQRRNGNGNGTSNSAQSTVKAKITIPDDPSKITISQEGSSGAACNSHGDCTTTGEICLPTGKCGYGFL